MTLQGRTSVLSLLSHSKVFSLQLIILVAAASLFTIGVKRSATAQISDTEQSPDARTTYKFTSFQPFSATTFTVVAIDNSGDVTGYYLNSSGVYEGYERSAKGTFSIIDDSNTYNTEAAGIDSKGTEIVGKVCIKLLCSGISEEAPQTSRGGCVCDGTAGFLLKDGAFTEYEFKSEPDDTAIAAINDNGVFVGSYFDSTTKLTTGFVSNGTTISYEGKGTTLTAINDNGIILGSGAAAFKANASGKILGTFTFPGAKSTGASGINNLGVVVGSFVDSSGLTHGFVLQKGTYTQIDAPGTNGTTGCHGINDSGTITGTYLDASNKLWGFFATP